MIRRLSLVILASLVAAWLLLGFMRTLQPSIPFNADRWRTGDASIRARMVKDPDLEKTLMGQSEEQVRTLLGPPDEIRTAFAGSTRYNWTYKIRFRLYFCDWSFTVGFKNGEVFAVDVGD